MMTDTSKSRWDELNRQKDTLLRRVSSGSATPMDLAQLEHLLEQSSSVATTLFKQGVAVIEKEAKARVDRVQEHRRNKGKALLTNESYEILLDRALAKSWLEYGPMLASDIQEDLEVLSDDMEKRFDEQAYTMMEYGEDANKSLAELRDVAYEIWDKVDQEKTPSVVIPKTDFSIVLDRIQLLFGSVRSSSQNVRDMSAKFDGLSSRLDELLEVNKDIKDFIDAERLSPRMTDDQIITDSQQVKDDIRDIHEELMDDEDPVEEDRERRRDWLNGFWRRFSHFSPSFGSHATQGLVKELMQIGSMLLLTNEDLRNWIGDRITDMKEFYDEFSLKKLMDDIWKTMGDQAKTLIDWVKIKMGLDDEEVQERRIENIDKDIAEYTDLMSESQQVLTNPDSWEVEKWWARNNIEKLQKWVDQRIDERQEAVDRLVEIRNAESSIGGTSSGPAPLMPSETSNNVSNVDVSTNYALPDIHEGDMIVEEKPDINTGTKTDMPDATKTSGTPPISVTDISFEPAINDQLRLSNILSVV